MKENNKKLKICVFSDIHGNIDELLKLTQNDDFKNADIHSRRNAQICDILC